MKGLDLSGYEPRLGDALVSNGNWRFERRVDVRSDPYLLDHVVAGAPVFPAAYLVGLMTQAAHRVVSHRRVLGLHDVRFVQAAGFKDGRSLQFSVTAECPEPDRVAVTISSVMEGRRAGLPLVHRTHGAGSVRMGEPVAQSARFQRLDFSGATDYAQLYRLPRDIQHGPAFRAGLNYRRPAPNLLLAVVTPPGELRSGWRTDPDAPGWPAPLLNAILHVAFSLGVLSGEKTVLPIALETAELHSIPQGKVQVLARLGSSQDGEQVFHVASWDEQGRPVALFRGFKLQESMR